MARLVEVSSAKWTKTKVQCYSGPNGEEPQSFDIGAQSMRVSEIVDRWIGPGFRYFKVKGGNRKLYVIRHNSAEDRWEMTSLAPNR